MDKLVYKVFEDKSTHSPTWKGQVLRNGVSILDINESDMGKAGMDDIHDVLNLEKYMKKEGMLPTSEKLKLVIANMTKAQLKAQLIASGIQVRGNFVKKSDIRAYVAKAVNAHELVKKLADKAHVDEEKLEHYLLGGPGSKDPAFTKELHDKTGMPDNWDSIDDLDAWMAKLGLNSKEIIKMMRSAHSSMATADEDWHISPESFNEINQHMYKAVDELKKALDLLEEYHQQNEALEPKFRDLAVKSFKELETDIQELSQILGESK